MTELERRSIVTRLGEGVDATGALGDAPRERVYAALEEYAAAIAEHGATATTAVMTSAVRDASNGGEFATAVRERYGLEGRTLSGDEEARLTFRGATAARDADAGRAAARDRHRRRLDRARDRRARRRRLPRLDPGRRRPPLRAPPALRPAHARGAGRARRRRRPRARRGGARRPSASGSRRRSRWRARRPSARASTSATRPTTSRATGSRSRRSRRCSSGSPRCRSRSAARSPGSTPTGRPTIVAGVVVLTRALAAFGLDEVEVSDRDILWGAALELASATLGQPATPHVGGFWTFVRLFSPGQTRRESAESAWAVVPPAVVR